MNASRDAQCLLDLFFRGTTHGRELSSPTQLPETSHGSTTFEPTFQSKLRRMLHEASIQSPPQRPAEFRTVNAKGTCATDSSGFKCRKRLGCCGSLGLLPSNASLVAAYIQHFIVDDAGATNVHAGVLARAMRTTCTERGLKPNCSILSEASPFFCGSDSALGHMGEPGARGWSAGMVLGCRRRRARQSRRRGDEGVWRGSFFGGLALLH